MTKSITLSKFADQCQHMIEQMQCDEVIVITDGGKPVAVLSPIEAMADGTSIIGALKGSVGRYDEPFAPATDVNDWDANR